MEKKNYDLEERTAVFAERLPVTLPILDQLLRAGTSMGANYNEANGASSKKDFMNKIFICKKEAKETQYWLRVLARALDDEVLIKECRVLWQEAKELTLIFSRIASRV